MSLNEEKIKKLIQDIITIIIRISQTYLTLLRTEARLREYVYSQTTSDTKISAYHKIAQVFNTIKVLWYELPKTLSEINGMLLAHYNISLPAELIESTVNSYRSEIRGSIDWSVHATLAYAKFLNIKVSEVAGIAINTLGRELAKELIKPEIIAKVYGGEALDEWFSSLS